MEQAILGNNISVSRMQECQETAAEGHTKYNFVKPRMASGGKTHVEASVVFGHKMDN